MLKALQRAARRGSSLTPALTPAQIASRSAASRAGGISRLASTQDDPDAEDEDQDEDMEDEDPANPPESKNKSKSSAEGEEEDPSDDVGDDETAEGDEEEYEGDEDDEADMSAQVANRATARCKAIVTSEAGLANPALAQSLAFDADPETGAMMSAKQAEVILKAAGPAQKASVLASRMTLYGATPGPDASGPAASSSDPVAVASALFGKRKAARTPNR